MTASPRALELALLAAEAASEKLATDIVALDVSETLVITDIFLLCTGASDRQVRAIVDAVEAKLDEINVDPVRREGEREGRWVLLDYLDIVVHVQHSDERSYYGLERLWKDGARIELPAHLSTPQDGTARDVAEQDGAESDGIESDDAEQDSTATDA